MRNAFLRRYMALVVKELQQLRRNRKLLIQLLIPPTLVLVLFGYALNPQVRGLRTGVVDLSRTPQSRELISVLTENPAFHVEGYYLSSGDAERAMRRLELDLFVVIPVGFAKSLRRGVTADVQINIDAVNANTGGIASGYLAQAIVDFNRRLAGVSQLTEARTTILYNPGSVNGWFIVTGVMSVLMFINGSLVASALAVREKEIGTLEQLLMSPAQTLELLLAKTTPVLVILMIVLMMALTVSVIVFGLPVRGSLALFLAAGLFAAFAGTGVGVMLATFSDTQQQAQLLTFFINPPLTLLSGAFTPIQNMPPFFQAISVLDPLRYLVQLVRGVTIKGAGLDVLWPPLAALAAFGIVLFGLSSWRFRRQLG